MVDGSAVVKHRMANKYCLLLFLVIMSAICEIESADYACKSKPVQMDIIVDWTKNIGSKDKNTVEQIIVKIISDLPAHSSVKVNAASGSIMTQIVSVSTPYANMSWSAKLYDYNLPQRGNSISLAAIDDELNSQFTVNKYRTKAELAVVFVSDSTKVVDTSKMLYKKKAIFVVFGDSVPSDYELLAITKNHTHLFDDGGNKLTILINSVISQISCASNHLCDRDEYRTERGHKCLSCTIPCGKDLMSPSKTCGERCPFLPPKENDIKPTVATEESSQVEEALVDYKHMFGWAVVVVFIVIAIGTVGLYCYCKHWPKNAMTPGNSQETMPKVPVNDVIVPLGVLESGENVREEANEDTPSPPEPGADEEEQTPFLPETGTEQDEYIPYFPEPEAAMGTDEHIPYVPGTGNVAEEYIPPVPTGNTNGDMGSSVTSGEQNDFGEGFSIRFSKVQELDANAHIFNGPEFQSLH